MKNKIIFITLGFCFYSLVSYCADANGCWQGKWRSRKYGIEGDVEVNIKQKRNSLSGNIDIEGLRVTKGGKISGQIKGESISFGFVTSMGSSIEYSGIVSGGNITGKWEVPWIGDYGTWQVERGCGGDSRDADEYGLSGGRDYGSGSQFRDITDRGGRGRRGGSGKLDEKRGVKCVSSGSSSGYFGSTTYYFKNGKLRIEGAMYSSMLSGIDFASAEGKEYSIVEDDGYMYQVGISKKPFHHRPTNKWITCMATKTMPVLTYDQAKRRVLDTFRKISSKMSPPYPRGTPVCEQADLENSFFKVPDGCEISSF